MCRSGNLPELKVSCRTHKPARMRHIYVLFLLLAVTAKSMSQIVIDSKGTRVAVDSSKWSISGNNIYNKNSGNIGIGTALPAAQLHTTGTVRFAGIGTNTTNTKVLTSDNSGNITTRTLSGLLSGNTLTSLNGLTGSAQSIVAGSAGTDFNISSSANTHVFNLPVASATNSGKLSAESWTVFNNKVGTVTASTPNAVTTASVTATINNTAAYWNANLLQGNAISVTAPASGQVLSWNGTAWAPSNAAPTNTTNALSSAANTITSVVNGISATANAVNSIGITSNANALTTAVNGIVSTPVNIINSNTLTQNGSNQLISTVNGVASSALTANLAGDITGNLGSSIVSKINGSPLGTTTSAANGQVLSWNGSSWTPANAAPAITTNTLNSTVNTITSTVNGVAASAPAVNSVSNTSNANAISTTVNGVSSAAVNIINSNTLSLNSGALSSTVNGVATPSVNVLAAAGNGLTGSAGNVKLGGALTQATVIGTSNSNTLSLGGLQTGTSSDSLLVVATGGVIKMIAAPVSFPQLLVDARRTTSYSVNSTYSTLIYNSTNVNVGTAYNTSTGIFTAPATGLYEIMISNNYSWGLLSSQQAGNQIVVNNVVDMEKLVSAYAAATTTSSCISGSTIINITAGQTVKITVGAEVGTATPLVGTGQHVLKIIRHQ